MPIYIYKCECGKKEKLYRTIAERDILPQCECGKLMKKDYKAMKPAESMHEVWGVDRIGRDIIHYKTFTELEREAQKRGYRVITGKEAASKD